MNDTVYIMTDTIHSNMQAAFLLFGIQMAAFAWRISREIKIADEINKNERSGWTKWFPRADLMNLFSIVILVLGVFILPNMSILTEDNLIIISKGAFGCSLILFAGYPFALAGHYDLFNKEVRSYKFYTNQEQIFILITSAVAFIFILFLLNPNYYMLAWLFLILFVLIFIDIINNGVINKNEDLEHLILDEPMKDRLINFLKSQNEKANEEKLIKGLEIKTALDVRRLHLILENCSNPMTEDNCFIEGDRIFSERKYNKKYYYVRVPKF